MSANPTDTWTAAEWELAMCCFEAMPDTATVAEAREAIDAVLELHRASAQPTIKEQQ